MNHAEWNARFKEAVRLSDADPEQAVARLLELAAVAEGAAPETIGEWHQQQALGAAGTFLEQTGELERAQEMYERTLRVCRESATYWSRATSGMLGIIALLQFRQGKVDDGMATGTEALRYLGQEPEAGAILAELTKEMAKHSQGKNVPQNGSATERGQ